jgi:hypothetical protein
MLCIDRRSSLFLISYRKIAFQSSKQLVQLSLPTEQTLQPKPTVDNPTTAAPRPSIDLSNELPDIKYHSQIIFNSYIGTVLMYRGSLRRQKFNVGRLSTKFAFPTGTSCAFRLQLRAKCGKWQKSICVLLFLERYGFSCRPFGVFSVIPSCCRTMHRYFDMWRGANCPWSDPCLNYV